MRIGEVAGRAGVPAKTIRFWEDQHLLPPPGRTPAGYRDYGPAILERLAFIRHSQAAGLTLDHIRQVLVFPEPDRLGRHPGPARHLSDPHRVSSLTFPLAGRFTVTGGPARQEGTGQRPCPARTRS